MLLLSPGVANCFWVIQNKKLKVYEAWRVVERLALRDRHRRPTGFRLGRKSCSNRDAWWWLFVRWWSSSRPWFIVAIKRTFSLKWPVRNWPGRRRYYIDWQLRMGMRWSFVEVSAISQTLLRGLQLEQWRQIKSNPRLASSSLPLAKLLQIQHNPYHSKQPSSVSVFWLVPISMPTRSSSSINGFLTQLWKALCQRQSRWVRRSCPLAKLAVGWSISKSLMIGAG